jgi:hypothetical protein
MRLGHILGAAAALVVYALGYSRGLTDGLLRGRLSGYAQALRWRR